MSNSQSFREVDSVRSDIRDLRPFAADFEFAASRVLNDHDIDSFQKLQALSSTKFSSLTQTIERRLQDLEQKASLSASDHVRTLRQSLNGEEEHWSLIMSQSCQQHEANKRH